jgi:O-antigen ligase
VSLLRGGAVTAVGVRRPPALDRPQRWTVAGALAAALVLGGALAVDLRIGLALIAVAAYVALLAYDLRLAVAGWIALVFLEDIPVLNAAGKAAGAAIALGWLAASPAIRLRRPMRDQTGVLVALGLLAVWLALSFAWTVDVGTTAGAVGQWYAVNLAFLVVATGMADRRAARLAAAAFVIGAVLSVLVGALRGAASVSEEGRFEGTLGDPNLLAAGLVPGAVLVVGLLAHRRGASWRWLGVAALAVLGGGLWATGSRGGLVGAGAALLAAAVVVNRRRAALLATIAVLALGTLAVSVWVQPAAWERTSEAGPGSGRTDLWKVGWQVAADHPLTGVGLDNYPEVAGDYVRRVGPLQGVDLIAVNPHEAHNLYLQMLAETGAVGVALFVAFALACLRSAWRAVGRFERAGATADAALARAVLVAGVAMLVSGVFISAGVDRRLWVLLALGPALLAAARPETDG